MWYFTWVLGLGLACAFGILNAMWYEINADDYGEADAVHSGDDRFRDAA